MNNRRIEIIIGTTRDIQIDPVGLKGPDCKKAIAFLDQAWRVVGQKNKEPEYHEGTVTINHRSVGR